MDTYTVTLTASQLDDIRTLTGETIPARKVPQKRTEAVTGKVPVLPPSDRMAAPYGTVSDGLEAYMTEHATPNYKTTYSAPKPFKFVQKKGAFTRAYRQHETAWNEQAARLWRAHAERYKTA